MSMIKSIIFVALVSAAVAAFIIAPILSHIG